MIDVRGAVDAVRKHLSQFPDLLQVPELQLEEFDFDEDSGEWIVTVSFLGGGPGSGYAQRVYKTFYVNGESGAVKAMKIRNPNAPV